MARIDKQHQRGGDDGADDFGYEHRPRQRQGHRQSALMASACLSRIVVIRGIHSIRSTMRVVRTHNQSPKSKSIDVRKTIMRRGGPAQGAATAHDA
jgi:hypothetical protein